MKKFLAAAACSLLLLLPGAAGAYGYGGRGGYYQPHHHHSSPWVPLAAGVAVGALITQSYWRPAPPPVVYSYPQPAYYAPPPQAYYPNAGNASVGAWFPSLPYGARRMFAGGNEYFLYNGVYYQRNGDGFSVAYPPY